MDTEGIAAMIPPWPRALLQSFSYAQCQGRPETLLSCSHVWWYCFRSKTLPGLEIQELKQHHRPVQQRGLAPLSSCWLPVHPHRLH